MDLHYEELEVAEEFGAWRDFFEGAAVGLGAAAAVCGIIALT